MEPLVSNEKEQTEEEDADRKIEYLLRILDRLNRWIRETEPCNCSKLYMEHVLRGRK
jgi:hypothetical protein